MRKDIVYNEWCVEHYGRVNWMKGAINYSDRVVAVSPTYAREILTGEYGEGMDYTLRGAENKLRGILNGIDYDVFNPRTDKLLVKNYDVNTLKNKEENKKYICDYFGLKYNPARPLFVMVSRLVAQKGIDLIRGAENTLRNMEADFVFLGSGEKDYENLFNFTGRASRVAANNETILAYVYGYDDNANTKVVHNLSRECHVPDQQARYMPSKAFCDSYLCLDGKPFGISELSDSSSYAAYFENRDPRMKQTVLPPGYAPYYGGRDGRDLTDVDNVFMAPRFNND